MFLFFISNIHDINTKNNERKLLRTVIEKHNIYLS